MSEKALDLLRSMMNNPDRKKCPDMYAVVAGNIAAFLIRTCNFEAEEEILACFALEPWGIVL